jgi:hypothetical protein
MRSLEVRWILPGPLDVAVARWFKRFPAAVESREDIYLVDPQLRGMSVKLRHGRALDVKVYDGTPGILEVASRARGRLESWDKWSFPCDPVSRGSADSPSWRPVHKSIRRVSVARGRCWPGVSDGGAEGEEPRCKVELTEVRVPGQAWWTVGFEATGPENLLRGELEATAALVFTDALPGGAELGTEDSQSYAQWLVRGQALNGPRA